MEDAILNFQVVRFNYNKKWLKSSLLRNKHFISHCYYRYYYRYRHYYYHHYSFYFICFNYHKKINLFTATNDYFFPDDDDDVEDELFKDHVT